ncbi:hypothetical protein WH47_11479 [Habropoda laboriosa]|uniref:Testicular haploid expressed gene protein-like n=1 Tax=Habropoda laboriosa TaxID=597456 RepID=A0A0L7QKZ4_9HYME|nr:hypothetical protein WH47_11479 [Habropoda laboriosa]
MAKLHRAIKPDEWDQHVELLNLLATPKVPPKPRFLVWRAGELQGKKKEWRPVNTRRIEELSSPVSRDVPEGKDPFTVPKTALIYRITKRLQTLAQHKSTPETPAPRNLGEVNKSALKAVASPWTIKLAKPVERPAGMQTDLREDAFTVLPRALKAKCSRRLKSLARPKKRS